METDPASKRLFDVTIRRVYTPKGQEIWLDAKRNPEQDSTHPEWAMSPEEITERWGEIHAQPSFFDDRYHDQVVAVVEADMEARRKLLRNRGGGCCELAVFYPCVCSYATTCPVHGVRHTGTHD